jgi:predicted ATPase
MKIREVRAQNLRNFGPDAPPVSFVDTDTNLVRPLTILVGANGSGKTTLLELIEALGHGAYGDLTRLRRLCRSNSQAHITLQYADRTRQPRSITLHTNWNTPDRKLGLHAEYSDVPPRPDLDHSLSVDLRYFPTLRLLPEHAESTITSPSSDFPRIYRYTANDSWKDSLEALWVWQNYLDLENQTEGHPNLLPFVETIQAILGKDQTIKIQRGKVWIERPGHGDRVRLHELPSGERQVIVIFGELIRSLKPGAIVLIDELEISLHPALQRTVLYHLRRLARLHDLQLILTTHSLEVVAYADPSEIVNLDDMVFVEHRAMTAEAAE